VREIIKVVLLKRKLLKRKDRAKVLMFLATIIPVSGVDKYIDIAWVTTRDSKSTNSFRVSRFNEVLK
jgi:hypothetical protein